MKPEREPQTSKVANSETNDSELAAAERLASAPTPEWSSPAGNKGRNKALDQLAREVRNEIDGTRRESQAIDRMAPDAAMAAELRNESDDEKFPPPDQVLTLRPDRSKSLALARSVRPFVNVLRPYLGVADPARVLEERLTGGRRLLSGMLAKHLAYGETRRGGTTRHTANGWNLATCVMKPFARSAGKLRVLCDDLQGFMMAKNIQSGFYLTWSDDHDIPLAKPDSVCEEIAMTQRVMRVAVVYALVAAVLAGASVLIKL